MCSYNATPKLSIVIPAYNASATIRRALESVVSQSFTDWEIVVCDDSSSDNTRAILKELAKNDDRIRIISTDKNSGHAMIPRLKAIEASKSDFIVQLDADDAISTDYLEKLWDALMASGADVVFGRMEVIGPDSKRMNVISHPENISSQTITGKEALLLTLYKWQISGLGAIRKNLYSKALSEIAPEIVGSLIYSDEILIRSILLHAGSVAFSDGTYFYYFNDESVTHNAARSYYQRSERDTQILKIINRYFSYPDEAWILAHRKNACQLVECLQLMANDELKLGHSQRLEMDRHLKAVYDSINLADLRKSVGKKIFTLLRFGYGPAKLMINLHERFKR